MSVLELVYGFAAMNKSNDLFKRRVRYAFIVRNISRSIPKSLGSPYIVYNIFGSFVVVVAYVS